MPERSFSSLTNQRNWPFLSFEMPLFDVSSWKMAASELVALVQDTGSGQSAVVSMRPEKADIRYHVSKNEGDLPCCCSWHCSSQSLQLTSSRVFCYMLILYVDHKGDLDWSWVLEKRSIENVVDFLPIPFLDSYVQGIFRFELLKLSKLMDYARPSSDGGPVFLAYVSRFI